MSFEVKDLCYSYNSKTKTLENISFSVPDSSFTSIIGKTGSGKTTLAKLIAGLLKAQSPCIFPTPVPGKTAMAFQYPENQFFETTVIKDVMFGPKNMGLDEKQAEEKARYYLLRMGIEEDLFEKDPFELSGGQQRKAAIAGILAMESKVLVLDEPGAGLDPVSRASVLDSIKAIANENKTTVFMISHNMDEVVKYSDYVLELENGKVKNFGKMRQVMEQTTMMPEITRICLDMGIKQRVLTLDEAIKAVRP